MKKLDNDTRAGLALLATGALIIALATHPPRFLCRLYLAIEKAGAVSLGFLLAMTGLVSLLGLGRRQDDTYTGGPL